MIKYKLLLSFCIVFGSVQCSFHNYCDQVCGNKQTHTLCKYQSWGPGANCTGYMSSGLSTAEKQRVLARLNRRRSQAAAGQLLALPAASNMMKLRWVEDLAMSAQRWADQCVPPAAPERLDQCRDMFSWTAGQAVASVTGDSPGLRAEALVDLWYMQSLHFQGNVTFYQLPSDSRRRYEGFAQLMWAKSYMVGCGRANFVVVQGHRHLSVYRLVCNFAPRGALPGRAVWMPGAACARCPAHTRCFSDYPGLCHYPESLKDLREAVDRAESEHEKQPIRGKVRRELRERMIEDSLTTRTMTVATLPPMLSIMVDYFPFLGYERSGANRLGSGLYVALCAVLIAINI